MAVYNAELYVKVGAAQLDPYLSHFFICFGFFISFRMFATLGATIVFFPGWPLLFELCSMQL